MTSQLGMQQIGCMRLAEHEDGCHHPIGERGGNFFYKRKLQFVSILLAGIESDEQLLINRADVPYTPSQGRGSKMNVDDDGGDQA